MLDLVWLAGGVFEFPVTFFGLTLVAEMPE